ncbi:hypothetical protein N431DRAFT_559154 [Stipitochalara longipes BDJ]|nr:hypothetical protein N431DRAFT_559154 [Stipitochalara longipes BDJ]
MATITYDAELMIQQVAAVAVPNTHSFVTIRDENGALMVFTVGSNGVFYVFKEDLTGALITINLSATLKIAPAIVTAFDVTQSPVNNTIYLTAASVRPGAGRFNEPITDLLVLRPFDPSDINVNDSNLDLSHLIMPRTGAGRTSISAIFMGDDFAEGSYPQVLFAYVPLDSVHQSTDLARIQVDKNFNTWKLTSDVSLPENAFKLISLAPGNLPFSSGVFVLYEIQDELQLIFTTVGLDINWSWRLGCPAGASSLTTFTEPGGYSSLLVGGQGLYRWKSDQAQERNHSGTLLTSHAVFNGVTELSAEQSGQKVSIFATNSAQGIGYALTSTSNPIGDLVVSPLIPDGLGGIFSPLISPDGKILQLIIADMFGVLTKLTLDTETKNWTTAPFYTPSLTENVEFQAYTVHINLTNPDLTPMIDQSVLLKSSGWVDIVVNGRNARIGPTGTPVLTDSDGILTLLVGADDISSYVFSVDNIPHGPRHFHEPAACDPTFKVVKLLDSIHDEDDLLNAKLQSGGTLLQGTTVPKSEIREAAEGIEALQARRKVVPADGHRLTRSPKDFPDFHSPGRKRSGKSLGKMVCGHNLSRIAAAQSITDMGWDAWYWLNAQLEKFKGWAIEQAERGVAFIVEIGGKFLRWAVDGLQDVAKATSWLLDKALEVADKIIDWLGWLMNWKDISKTQASVVSLINSSIQSGSINLNVVAEKAEVFFDNLEEDIKNALYPEVLKNKVANPVSTENPVIDPGKNINNSVQGNYTKYQFSHGGAGTASNLSGSEISNPLQSVWVQLVEPAWNSLQKTMETISDGLVLLFVEDGKSISVEQVLQKIGVDVLIGIVDAFKTLIVGLIKLGADILDDLKTYLNYELNIPVFSALWKKYVSGGKPFTLLSGLSFLLAIPLTVVSKLITGAAPPDMTNVNYNGLVDGTITDHTELLKINSFMSVTSTTANTLKGVIAGIAAISPIVSSDGKVNGDQHHKQDLHLAKFLGPNALQRLLEQEQLLLDDAFPLIALDWQLALGLVTRIPSIPFDKAPPGYPIRWVSFFLGCGNTLIRAAIRKVTLGGVSPATRAKALAVLEGVVALINFALISAVNGMELTEEWNGKDDTVTTLRVFSSVFDLISTLGADGAILTPEPQTKGACVIANYTGLAFSGIITGAVQVMKIQNGEYNWIMTKL